jgi:hypothetical protein
LHNNTYLDINKCVRFNVLYGSFVEMYNNYTADVLIEQIAIAKALVSRGALSQEDYDTLINIVPDKQKKYIGWMAKQWANKNVTDINVLQNTVNAYHSYLERNPKNPNQEKEQLAVTNRDIYQYKTFKSLKQEIDHINETGKNVSVKDLESDYETIRDDEDLLVMVPHTHEASRKIGLSYFAFRDCKGGKDSAWCTTYKAPDHFNDNYFYHNVAFYYVRVKSQELKNQLKAQGYGPSYEVVAIALSDDDMSARAASHGHQNIVAYDGMDKQFKGAKLSTYLDIIGLSKSVLIPRRSRDERLKNYNIAIIKKVQVYIKRGSKGDLDLSNTPTTSSSLPNGLVVGGDLDLTWTQVTALPTGLNVKGSLILTNTPIKSLPTDLKVGENMYLDATEIESLPANLKVNGYLHLAHATITSLPENLTVNDLNIYGTHIKTLPKGLHVKNNLYMQNTPITSLPPDLKVGGEISKDYGVR